MTPEIVLVGFYCVIAIAVGWITGSAKHRWSAFAIADRRVGGWRTGLSIFATLVTESLIFFSVSLTSRFGPLVGMVVVLGPCVAMLVISLLAPRVHARGARDGHLCITEYCAEAWGPVAGRFARWALIANLLWIVILQINLNGNLMAAMLGCSVSQATMGTVIIVLVYTILGGYRAVLTTDVFQALIIMLMIALPLIIRPAPDFFSAVRHTSIGLEPLGIFAMSATLTLVRPEVWQRVLSAASPRVAVLSLRWAALLFLVLGAAIFYYALSIVQAAPGLGNMDAFTTGYRFVLPMWAAPLFAVVLLAAMMSSLDSAVFLFALDVTRSLGVGPRAGVFSVRIALSAALIGGGLLSLFVFDTLTFAYKLNGIVALIAAPLILSQFYSVPPRAVLVSLLAGGTVYALQLVTGRISTAPDEAIFGALIATMVLVLSTRTLSGAPVVAAKNRDQ